MSLIHRKPRPLKRDTESLRDDRLFIIACDDTYAPKQYFDFYKITRIKVHVVITDDGTSTAQSVLGRLLEYDHEDDDERWMILDTDHCTEGTHKKGFIQAIKEAKERGINTALSKHCFELWLLLHHLDKESVKNLSNATETEALLRKTLGEYNKKKLKPEHYPLSSVLHACAEAESLDQEVGGGDIPDSNTSRVYLIWNAIAAKGLPSQLPDELKSLLPKP